MTVSGKEPLLKMPLFLQIALAAEMIITTIITVTTTTKQLLGLLLLRVLKGQN
jgi:hypothetical protein